MFFKYKLFNIMCLIILLVFLIGIVSSGAYNLTAIVPYFNKQYKQLHFFLTQLI